MPYSSKWNNIPRMAKIRTQYYGLAMLASLLLALSIFAAGMRVPDLGRPYRPKPMQRAVLEKEETVREAGVKAVVVPVAVVPVVPGLDPRQLIPLVVVVLVVALPTFTVVSPRTSRAPPCC